MIDTSNEVLKKKAFFYREGYNLAIANADSLLKISELSATNKEMGIATSLSILATEEALKAHVLLLQSGLPEMQVEELDQIFSSHSIKHKNAKSILVLRETSLAQLREVLLKYPIRLEVLKLVSNGPNIGIKERVNPLIENAERILNSDYLTIPDADIINWSSRANQDKNGGFYVGITNGKWHDPRKNREKKYKQNLSIAKLMIECAKQFAGLSDLTSLYEQNKQA